MNFARPNVASRPFPIRERQQTAHQVIQPQLQVVQQPVQAFQPSQQPPVATAVPPSDQPPGQPTVPVKGKNNIFGKIFSLIPGILIIIAIILAGYLANLWFSRRTTQTPEPTPVPQFSPSPTPTPPPKKLSYVNQRAGFAFKYPETMVLVGCSGSVHLVARSAVDEQSLSLDPEVYCQNRLNAAIAVHFGRRPPDLSALITAGGGFEQLNDKFAKQDAVKYTGSYATFLTFSYQDVYYLISVIPGYEEEFAVFSQTFEFVSKINIDDWETYTNSQFGYRLKHPPDWSVSSLEGATESAKKVEIKKESGEKIPSLTIESFGTVEDAELTASQTIASARNLSGWETTPSLSFSSTDGGTAEFLSGQFDDRWHVFVVVWFENRVYQMVWYDSLAQQFDGVFEAIMSTFEFLQIRPTE